MATETTAGSFTGAAQGAEVGAKAGGPWGAVIGAIVGGIAGGFAGDKRRKAKRYLKKAQAVRRQQQTMQLAVQRRDLVRQMRIQRAQAVAAGASDEGVQSSAVIGATASVSSQGKSAVGYFDKQISLDNLYQQFMTKAGRAAEQANEIQSYMNMISSAVNIGGDIGGSIGGSKTASTGSTGYTSFNDTAAYSGFANNSAWSGWGSSLNLSN